METIGAQLRRRREAALRLPPLTDGRRDPIELVRPPDKFRPPVCNGEFGTDGTWQRHCQECAA